MPWVKLLFHIQIDTVWNDSICMHMYCAMYHKAGDATLEVSVSHIHVQMIDYRGQGRLLNTIMFGVVCLQKTTFFMVKNMSLKYPQWSNVSVLRIHWKWHIKAVLNISGWKNLQTPPHCLFAMAPIVQVGTSCDAILTKHIWSCFFLAVTQSLHTYNMGFFPPVGW